MAQIILSNRLEAKSISGLFSNHLQNRYRLSPIAAETLSKDAIIWRDLLLPESRRDGQIIYHVVKLGQPASKKIRDCEMVKVKLTLMDPEDIKILKQKGSNGLTLHIFNRLWREAYEQGGILSSEDMQYLLHISPRTVVRYKKQIQLSGGRVILRGDIEDIGPGITHRRKIVSLYLQGYSETEIGQRTDHSLDSVEEYIYDFVRVGLMHQDGYQSGSISRLAKLSKAKVNVIINLYEEFLRDDFYRSALDNVINIFKLKRQFKKGGAVQ